jgi:hypothetical protein
MNLKSVDPSPLVSKSPSHTNFTMGDTFCHTNLAIVSLKLPLAANPPKDAKASWRDAGSGLPVDMVGCAIAAVQQLDLCEQAMQWMKPGNQFLNLFCTCHHCHVFRQGVLV